MDGIATNATTDINSINEKEETVCRKMTIRDILIQVANTNINDSSTNQIIKLFEDETAKIEMKANLCNQLLYSTNSLVDDVQSIGKSFKLISPNTDKLLSECNNVIQQRTNLKETYQQLNSSLKKHLELQSVMKRMPDIKNQIINILRSVFENYKDVASTELTFEQFYSRFYKECRNVNELATKLETISCSAYSEELSLNLEEIYTFYSDNRILLIEKSFAQSISQIITSNERNYSPMFIQASQLFSKTIRNESQLFSQIFNTPVNNKEVLMNLINPLGEIFYEQLLPVIIKIVHLETLAGLQMILSQLLNESQDNSSFTSIINRLIEEVNERLVFRTQVYINENICNYSPSSGDLAYPEKLEVIRKANSKDSALRNYQSLWYPTVQRGILAMVYLRKALNQDAFTEIVLDILLACLDSLKIATKLIEQRNNNSTIESTFFLTEHVQILKEQLELYGINANEYCNISNILASLTTKC